jgi:hypothetical protein
LLPVAALIVGLSLATPEPMASQTTPQSIASQTTPQSMASETTPASMAPRLSADLDGDGVAESVTASGSRGVVSLRVENGATHRAVAAKAPAPAADVVRVSLTTAPLGTPGSLLEVTATTDGSECLSVWRYHDGSLARLSIRGAGGKELPDCAAPGGDGAWTHRWERSAPDVPSVLVRERTTKVERGTLRRRETFAFAGFSLDLDPDRSGAEIEGVPIPAWYDARYYTQKALQQLYARFDMRSFRAAPHLRIEADRDRGIFNLRFTTPSQEVVAPVESFSSVRSAGTASVVARAGERTVHADVRLGSDPNVPFEVRVDGLGSELDQTYGPAGTWEGRARRVFPSAADETVAEYLAGDWRTPQGGKVTMGPEGSPPYRVRVDERVFTLIFDHPSKEAEAGAEAADLALVPADGSRRGWRITLGGPNALDRLPLDCDSAGDGFPCRPDGTAERLRRIGARINVN